MLPTDLIQAKTKYSELESLWAKNLKSKGVKKPPKFGTKGSWFYLYAYCNLGKSFKGMDVAPWAMSITGVKITEDPQVLRHMSNVNGYNARGKDGLLPDGTTLNPGEYSLIDVINTTPDWKKNRASTVATGDWNSIKQAYGNRCACCGSKENESHNKKSGIITKLEKGHMDPSKDLISGNIIPQCTICNKPYKNNAVFDSEGYVVALGNATMAIRSNDSVKKDIIDALYKSNPELFVDILCE